MLPESEPEHDRDDPVQPMDQFASQVATDSDCRDDLEDARHHRAKHPRSASAHQFRARTMIMTASLYRVQHCRLVGGF